MFEVEKNRKIGKILKIDSRNSTKKTIDYIKNEKIDAISINQFDGYKNENIKSYTALSCIKKMFIVPRELDISGLEDMQQLTHLFYDDAINVPFDFGRLKKLQHLHIEWNKNISGLEELDKLKSLNIKNYKGSHSELKYPKLTELMLMKSSATHLDFLKYYPKLKKLGLFYMQKLIDANGLSNVKDSLAELEIKNCKKAEFEKGLNSLAKLEELRYSHSTDFKNLKFVSDMKKLKYFAFVGVKVKSGDIKPCVGIDYVGFENKKNYNCQYLDGKAVPK